MYHNYIISQIQMRVENYSENLHFVAFWLLA